MKKLLIISIIVYTILIVSCSKDSTPIPNILIHYIDKTGNGLFTNSQISAYNKDSVYLLLLNGNIIPNGIYFVPWANSTMEFSPSPPFTGKYSTMIIQLKIDVFDTLRMHLTSTHLAGGATIDSIWYNRQLKKAGTQIISGVTNPDMYTTQFSVVH